jgi:hypothetical protein
MAVDPHGKSLAPPPHCHDARNERIIPVRMLIDDHQTAGSDAPFGLALIALSLAVMPQDRRFNVVARESEPLRLLEGVRCPAG